jgi:hypothetical protein
MGGGYQLSSRILTYVRLFNASVGTTVVILKIIADIRKHSTHDSHHQLCDCLGICYVCLYTSAAKLAQQKRTVKNGR